MGLFQPFIPVSTALLAFVYVSVRVDYLVSSVDSDVNCIYYFIF